MARALRAWAINRGGKNSVRNLQYSPRTRLVRGIYVSSYSVTLSKTLLTYHVVHWTLKCYMALKVAKLHVEDVTVKRFWPTKPAHHPPILFILTNFIIFVSFYSFSFSSLLFLFSLLQNDLHEQCANKHLRNRWCTLKNSSEKTEALQFTCL